MTDSAPSSPPPGWQPTGWPAPAPQPGVVPLRPLAAGDVLAAALRVVRRGFRSLVGTALLFQLGLFVVVLGVLGLVALAVVPTIVRAVTTNHPSAIAGPAVVVAVVIVVASFVGVAVQGLLQGLIAVGVSRQVLGERPRLPELVRRARGRIGAVMGWSLLLVAATLVAFGIFFGLGALPFATGRGAGAAIGGLVFFLGGLGVEVALVWITVKCCLVPSILMLERLTLRAAIARSWRLTRRRFWPTLGALALVALIVYVATLAVTLPFSISAQFALPFGATSTSGVHGSTIVHADLVRSLVPLVVLSGIGQALSVVVGAAGLVLVSSAITLVYVDLRCRSERLDLELLRYVEERDGGAQDPADPYLPPSASPPSVAPGAPSAPPAGA